MFDVLQMLGGGTVPTKAFKLSNYSSMDCEGNTKYEGIISVYMKYLLVVHNLTRVIQCVGSLLPKKIPERHMR